jgi:hypothetical protein
MRCGCVNAREGAVGTVMGPCEDASLADKEQQRVEVNVDFDNKG